MPWSVKDGSKRLGVPVRRRNWVSAYVISLFIFSVYERERSTREKWHGGKRDYQKSGLPSWYWHVKYVCSLCVQWTLWKVTRPEPFCQGHTQKSCQLNKEIPAARGYWSIPLKQGGKKEGRLAMKAWAERISMLGTCAMGGPKGPATDLIHWLMKGPVFGCPRRGRIEKSGYTPSPL